MSRGKVENQIVGSEEAERVRWALIIVGGLMVLMGGTWLLQGIGILPGSFMTGQVFWAVVGAIVVVVGAALCYLGARRTSRPR